MTGCVIHIICYIFKVKNGNRITFAQFEQGNLLSETHNNTESGNKSGGDSTLAPLIGKETIEAMSSDAEPISIDVLEDICDGSQSHPSINRREAHYNISDQFKQRQVEYKGSLLSTQNMGKGLHKVFKAVVNELSQALPILGESV